MSRAHGGRPQGRRDRLPAAAHADDRSERDADALAGAVARGADARGADAHALALADRRAVASPGASRLC